MGDNIYILILLAMGGILLMVIAFILINSRSQNKMLRQRQQMHQAEIAHQKELLQAVIESQEAERKRIGQDLHDDVGSALSSLRLTIEMLQPDNGEDGKYIQMSKDIIDKVVKDVRHISHNLSPPMLSYYGLAAAIEEKCLFINHSGQLEISVENTAADKLELLALPVSLAFYRVLEELLNNTIKHAGASKAYIKFNNAGENAIAITYEDNGRGLGGMQKKGMGLQNIESRLEVINATYEIAAEGAGFGMEINYRMS